MKNPTRQSTRHLPRRRHLRLVDENYRSPFVDAVFRYDANTDCFDVDLLWHGEPVETRTGRAHAKRDLTLWFQSIDGEKPRIPWSRIAESGEWHARVLMQETFFEARGLN